MGAPRGRCARGEKREVWASAPDEDATRAARRGKACRKCSARSALVQSGHARYKTPPCKHHATLNARPYPALVQGGRRSTKRRQARRDVQRSKAFRQTSARSSLTQSGALDALGRRGREADPDSRAEAKRGVSAKREKHRVRGRRHLAVNSEVSARGRTRAEGPAVSSERHGRMPFAPYRAKRGSGKPAGFPRLWNIFP